MLERLENLPGFGETHEVEKIRAWALGITQESFFASAIESASLSPKAFPVDFLREAAKFGLTGMEIPESYGGLGMSCREQAVVMEELSKKHAGLALNILVLNSLTAYEISQFGSEEQKREFLPKMADGRMFACFGLTEPDKGSDAKNIELSAEWKKDRKGFVLNGAKRFITGANGSDLIVLATRTGLSGSGEDGITVFLVDTKTSGISIPEPYSKLGQPGSALCEIYFDNVFVSEDTRLGDVNGGWKIIQSTLRHSRNWIAAQGVGIAQRAYDEAYKYAHERKAFGRYLVEIEKHAHTLEVIRIQTAVARALVRLAADREDSGKDGFPVLSSLAKLVACDTATWAATEAMQLHGGIGYTSEMPISQVWLDSPVLRIYEGTVPVQINIVVKGGISKEVIYDLLPPKLSSSYLLSLEEMVHPEAVGVALRQLETSG